MLGLSNRANGRMPLIPNIGVSQPGDHKGRPYRSFFYRSFFCTPNLNSQKAVIPYYTAS